MDIAKPSVLLPTLEIRRLGPTDIARLEAHCLRLSPYDALDLFGAQAVPVAVKRYAAGIEFDRDILFGALDHHEAVTATAYVRTQRGSRWADLLLTRECDRVACEQWMAIICAAVAAANSASVGWLGVTSLGYDPETRDALELVGFDLQAEEEGTIGELCLGHAPFPMPWQQTPGLCGDRASA